MAEDLCGEPTKKGTPCTNHRKKGEQMCASHLGTTARPSKLAEARLKIVEALEIGNTKEGAAAYAGVHRTTLYGWLEVGEADQANGVQSEQAELFDAATRAEGFAEQSLVAEVRKSAVGFVNPTTRKREGKDWRAAAWMLGRRYADRWGQQHKVKHSGSVRTESVEVPDSRERLEEVGGILADIGAAGGEG